MTKNQRETHGPHSGKTALLRGMLLTLLLLIALRDDVVRMMFVAATFSEWSHGWAVPLLIALFIYLRRCDLSTALRPPSFWGLLLVSMGLFVWLTASSFGLFAYLRLLAIPIALVGIVLLVAGHRVLLILLPTVIMVGTCLPLDERSMNRFSIPVQSISVKLAAALLNASSDEPVRGADRELLIGKNPSQMTRIGQGEQRFGFRMMPGCVCLAMFVIFAPPRSGGIRMLMFLSLVALLPIANVARLVVWTWFDSGDPMRLDESMARNVSAMAALGTTFVGLVLVGAVCSPILRSLATFLEVNGDGGDENERGAPAVEQTEMSSFNSNPRRNLSLS